MGKICQGLKFYIIPLLDPFPLWGWNGDPGPRWGQEDLRGSSPCLTQDPLVSDKEASHPQSRGLGSRCWTKDDMLTSRLPSLYSTQAVRPR